MSQESKPKASIQAKANGPYVVHNVGKLANRKGAIEGKPTMALCRCGGSHNKPFCDGSHAKLGFSSAKLEGRLADRRDDYKSGRLTIRDNRSLCAHAGRCTEGLAKVFRYKQEPWIDPAAASVEEIIAVVKRCPSGALTYTLEGEPAQPAASEDAAIFVAPNGPYVVTGDAELADTAPASGAASGRMTLCRCGGSKNKPFCDGTHWSNGFADERN